MLHLVKIENTVDVEGDLTGDPLSPSLPDLEEDGKEWSCGTCGKTFRSKSGLHRHEKSHRSEKDSSYPALVCEVCGRAFKRMHKCEKQQQHACPLCNRCFRSPSSLTFHLRAVHTGERPFECEDCSEAFPTKAGLQYHRISRHSQERPYKCGVCEKGFKLMAALKTHSLMHQEKTHHCPDCGRSFARKNCLAKHAKKIHSAWDGTGFPPKSESVKRFVEKLMADSQRQK